MLGPKAQRRRGARRSDPKMSETTHAPKRVQYTGAPESAWCYLDGEYLPLAEARVSVATHALNYGTGCFEGIRAYWSETDSELFVLHLVPHYRRLARSARLLRITPPLDPEGMAEVTLEMLRRSGYREDTYIRPLLFKSDPLIKVGLSGLSASFAVFAVPMGDYVSTRGLDVMVSSWQRTPDNAIPGRAKLTGSYLNAALSVDDAHEAGFDEAILLTRDGHVAEGSAANLFMVRDGVLITPPVTDDILEGITRTTILTLAQELGIPSLERSIDRTELYACDELFLCGTGVQVAPIHSVDRRPVGDGQTGPVTQRLLDAYRAVCRAREPRHRDWLTPVYRRAEGPGGA
jgi:branched-chain amino acid aminotransferase